MDRIIRAWRRLLGKDVLGRYAKIDCPDDVGLPTNRNDWLEEAAFQDEHAAHCSTDIPASIND